MTLTQNFEHPRLMPEFGEGVRRVVYREYSFVYRIESDVIEILTICCLPQ